MNSINRNDTYEIPFTANSVTQTPPPAWLNSAPYDLVVGFVIIQPSFWLAKIEQSVELMRVLV